MRIATTTASRVIATAAALGLFAAANAASASTSTTTATTQPAAKPAAAAPASSSDVRVFVDQKTGKLRAPTPEERAAAAAEEPVMIGKAQSIKLERQPNGLLRGTDREGLLANAVLVHKNADGTLSYTEVQGPSPGDALDQVPAAKLEEK